MKPPAAEIRCILVDAGGELIGSALVDALIHPDVILYGNRVYRCLAGSTWYREEPGGTAGDRTCYVVAELNA
jgi:hypothetical protein